MRAGLDRRRRAPRVPRRDDGRRRAVVELRGSWRQWLVLGVIANAVPFWLVAWGEQHVDSGVAAIAQSTVPLFTILLGLRFLPHEPLSRAGSSASARPRRGRRPRRPPPEGGWWAVAGTLAVVLSSLAYAAGTSSASAASAPPGPGARDRRDARRRGRRSLPFALLQVPSRDARQPTRSLSLLALALLGTALAQLLLYRMLRLYGGRRASLVTYLMPGFALVYGSLLLDEPVTAAARRWARADPRGRRARLRRAGLTSSRAARRLRRVTVDAATGDAGRRRVPRRALSRTRTSPRSSQRCARRPRGAGRADLERADGRAGGVRRARGRGGGHARPAPSRWERVNRRSRIASVSGFAIDPARRGEGVGVEAARAIQRHLIRDLGFHRLQMEVYASTSGRSATPSARAGSARGSGARRTGGTARGSTASCSASSRRTSTSRRRRGPRLTRVSARP